MKLVIVLLDDARFGAGPATVLETKEWTTPFATPQIPSKDAQDELLRSYVDKDVAHSDRLRVWLMNGDPANGDRVVLRDHRVEFCHETSDVVSRAVLTPEIFAQAKLLGHFLRQRKHGGLSEEAIAELLADYHGYTADLPNITVTPEARLEFIAAIRGYLIGVQS